MRFYPVATAIALTCVLAGPAGAKPPSNNPFMDAQYTCDFPPTDGYRLGRIYRVDNKLSNRGFTEKSQLVNSQFEIPFASLDKMAVVAGMATSRVEKVSGSVALNYLTSISGAGVTVDASLEGAKSVTIKRSIPQHYFMETSDVDVQPAMDWWDKYKKSAAFKKYKNEQFFIVREVRLAEGMSVSITKEQSASAGAKVAGGPDKVGGGLQTTSNSAYSMDGKFPRLSTFCLKVERLK